MNLPIPMPTTIRPTNKTSFWFDKPIITEPAVNTRLASRITGFRPTLSGRDITQYTISYLLRLFKSQEVLQSLMFSFYVSEKKVFLLLNPINKMQASICPSSDSTTNINDKNVADFRENRRRQYSRDCNSIFVLLKYMP